MSINLILDQVEKILLREWNLSSPVEVPPQLEEEIKKIKWESIDWGDPQDDGTSIISLKCNTPYPEIDKGIAVNIQLIPSGDDDISFYQIHIELAPSLRGLGLGYKIYKSLIHIYGHLYSGKKRIQNPEVVQKIWKKLTQDSSVECIQNSIASLCISKNNPDMEDLKILFNSNF